MGNNDKLFSYDSPLSNQSSFARDIDEKNNRIIMNEQFEIIQRQKKELINASKFREEISKNSKYTTRLAIFAIIIATATLFATIIGWFI